MTQAVDLLLAGNNQHFFLPVDVSQLAQFYSLGDGTFRMQARATPLATIPVYSWSSNPNEQVPGTIEYIEAAGLIAITAPYEDVRQYLAAGQYPYDLQWESDNPVPEYIVMDLWAGTLTVEQGVTLR